MSKQVSEEMGEQEWYIWTVRTGKFEVVKRYIEQSVPEIKKVLYPTITTEKRTRKGDVRKKKSPLYAGYMFLQYDHDEANPIAWLKVNRHPFVTGYVGPCSTRDLASVDSLQKVEKLNNDKVCDFIIGDKVRVSGGVFVDYSGYVICLTGNSVGVELRSDNKTLKVVFSPEDLDILERVTDNKKG